MNTKPRHHTAASRQHSLSRRAHRVVKFCCEAAMAEGVRLGGDFNGWDLGATRMRRTTDGRWVASLTLNRGSYTYVFIVDGNLTLDPDASITTGNEQVSLITID